MAKHFGWTNIKLHIFLIRIELPLVVIYKIFTILMNWIKKQLVQKLHKFNKKFKNSLKRKNEGG